MKDFITMTDKLSFGFQIVNESMNPVLNNFGAIRYASYNAMDTSSFQSAQNEINKTSSSLAKMEGILGKISYKKVFSIAGQFLNLADTVAQTTARLDLIKDEMKGGMETEEIQQKIFDSAQASRSPYLGTAAAVAKIGTMADNSFGGVDEIIAFTELMNKNFIIGGASVKEQGTAMAKLTQAMAEGKLQGEGLQAVMGVSPLLMQGIEEQMRNAGVGGTMADWAKDGRLTTDVIKAALFSMSDEIEQRFIETPMTWAQVWQVTMDQLLRFSEPILGFISMLADNWEKVEPFVWGVASAVAAYVIASNAAAVAMKIAAFAQEALNLAMKASPIVWIALVIGLVVAAIVKWVQSVGGLRVAWLITVNTVLSGIDSLKIGFFSMLYYIMDLCGRFGLAVSGAIASVLIALGDMKVKGLLILQDFINGAIDRINKLIGLAKNISGVSIDVIDHVTFGTEAAVKNEAEKSAIRANLARKEQEINAKIMERQSKINDMQAKADAARSRRELEIEKAKKAGDSKKDFSSDSLNNINSNVSGIEDNTRSMADSMSISEEDIKYLRDIAEREVINRFTTADLSVTMQTTANVNSALDIDGVISQLENKTYEMLISTAEGV